MPWIITNSDWFNTFDDGDFEGGPGTAVPGVSDGNAQYGLSTLEHHTGARSFRVSLVGSPSTTGLTPKRRSLVRFLSGTPIITARRYTVTGWVKVTSAGLSKAGDIVDLFADVSNNQSPGQKILGDIRNNLNVWKQFTYQVTAGGDISASNASLSFNLQYDTFQVQQQPLGHSTIEGVILFFDSINVVEERFQPPPPMFLSETHQNVTSNGGSNGSIDLIVSGGSGSFTYEWNDGTTTQDRFGLSAGSYTVTVRDTESLQAKSLTVIITQADVLTAGIQITNVTTSGGSDGTATLSIFGGSGVRTIVWDDGPTGVLFRGGLSAGVYTATVTDSVTGEVVVVSGTVRDPGLEEITGTFLDVPMMNSLRFVVNPAPNDNKTRFQNTRNTLLRDMKFPGFECTDYLQKVMTVDEPVLQFHSDFTDHAVELYNYRTLDLVRVFTSVLKEQNTGIQDSYSIRIQNHTGNVGKSRVYFQAGAPPIPISVGDPMDINNNLDGFDGSYTVVDIVMDNTVNYPYLVINRVYDAPGTSSLATGVFFVNSTEYNVFESVMSMLGLPEGEYFVKLTARDAFNNMQFAVSEPIDLREDHPKTLLFEGRNSDNAFDITWTTGYVTQMRIPAMMPEETTGGEGTTNRNSDYSLKRVSARMTHVITVSTWMLPPWLHVKLGVFVKMDNWSINKVAYQTDEDYEKPKYIDQFKLANSSVDIEELQFFRKYNTRGVSSVESGFILGNNGFLRR